MKRIMLRPVYLILLSSIYIALIDNFTFWLNLSQRLDLFDLKSSGLGLTLFLLIAGILALFFLIVGQKFLLKPLLILFLIGSSLMAYFNGIGVVFDKEMIHNMLETVKDHNNNEVTELLSVSLLTQLFFFGLLPSVFVLVIKIRYKKLLPELLMRLGYVLGIIAVIGALIMLDFKYVTYFSRENRDLRMLITPIFPITSAVKLFKRSHASDETPFRIIGSDAVQAHGGRKRVGILVVGETARADHFSLNGYSLETNPLLSKQDVISYRNMWSCGTSTAYSVPCMFSFLERQGYSPGVATKQSNVLDVLEKAGVKTYWRDNNSSCKGVCERIETENFHHDYDVASPFYNQGEYVDEILLDKLGTLIKATQNDVLIVLHTMGSHGPAYYKRYPEAFAAFKPVCESNSPYECSDDLVANGYDNTIVYTDFILNKIIALLKNYAHRYDTFMLYVSDHGESLGENGIYLHGLPYVIAPDAQKHVPMIAWLSDGLKQAKGLDEGVIAGFRDNSVSHDYLAHTLLGLFDIETGLYKKKLNLFSGGGYDK